MTCGIYKLKFVGTDMVYIGLSENIEQRWASHKYSFLHRNSSAKLQKAYNTYGMPILEVLCECNASDLDVYEKEAIEIYNSIENGFNTRNGGATGGGRAISGERNGHSKYTDNQIREAFCLLSDTKLSQSEISEITGVSVQAISHISAGTGHKWLKNEYQDRYDSLIQQKRTTLVSKFPLSLINLEDQTTHTVTSYKDIQNLLPCAYTSAVALVSGEKTCLFNKWKLENPIIFNRVKKFTYTLEHVFTKEIVNVNSKLAFVQNKNIVNRPKFTKFLKTGIIGSIYQDWKLVSIS